VHPERKSSINIIAVSFFISSPLSESMDLYNDLSYLFVFKNRTIFFTYEK